MKKTIIIDGTKFEAQEFKTLKATQNYMRKHPDYKMVYFQSHQYFLAEK